MTDKPAKTSTKTSQKTSAKPKRPSKSQRTHTRRVKQSARKTVGSPS